MSVSMMSRCRTAGSVEPPRELTLEAALEYIEDDELIEVTPQGIRLRKRFLNSSDRKKLTRDAKRERISG
jgi:GTP-binding protein